MRNNTVQTSDTGIFVGARMTFDGGAVTVEDVEVKGNDVSLTDLVIHIRAKVSQGIIATARLTEAEIEDNVAHHNRSRGLRIEARDLGSTVDSIEVENNTAVNNGEEGIALIPRGMGVVTKIKVERNFATLNGRTGGIALIAPFGTVSQIVVRNNRSHFNHVSGFFAATGSDVNVFEDNVALSNARLGFEDPAPASQNTYDDNICVGNAFGGSLPAGLCGPQP